VEDNAKASIETGTARKPAIYILQSVSI